MSNWIEINLPYDKVKYFDDSDIEFPELDDRAKEQLGFNMEDVKKLQEKVPSFDSPNYEDFDNALSELNRQLSDEFPERNTEWRNERVRRLLASSNEGLNALGKHLEKRFQLEDWENKQPEFIAYDKEYREKSQFFHDNLKKESFSGLGLNKPGTLIEVKVGDEVKQYLIGHINPICGVCDDCCEFDSRTAIVLRYKVIWSDETN